MVTSRLRVYLTTLLGACCFFVAATPILKAAPTVVSTAPQAVAPGKQIDIKLRGSDLAGASQLWTQFGAAAQLTPDVKDNGKNAAEVTWRVNVPANMPVGIHGLRVAGPNGASSLKLIMVDDLPSVAQTAGNTVIGKAQELAQPSAVDGAVANLEGLAGLVAVLADGNGHEKPP